MSLWRQISRGLRALTNRKATDQELAAEVDSYLEQAAEGLVAGGLSPDEARRAARLELGSAAVVKEQVRGYGWENRVETFAADLRHAARRLARNPGFSAVSVLTLALGIGATTAIFAVIDGVLLKPLPFRNSERLVSMTHTAPGVNIKDLNMSPSLYFTYREEGRVFEDLTLWIYDAWSLTGIAEPEKVMGVSTTHRFLPLLGVEPALGRNFSERDEDPRGQRTAILTDEFWRSRFGGDRSVIGRKILLDGNAVEVIGVLPRSFRFLDRPVSMLAPLRFNRAEVQLISFCCIGFARLRQGATLAQAEADVTRMLPLAPLKFAMNPGLPRNAFREARIAPSLKPARDWVTGDISNTLWVLMAAVAIVLSIACANVANLFLVRAEGRRLELATRAALGAGWGRLAQELLLESLLLSLGGGAMGMLLAYAAVRGFVASELTQLPRIRDISIDPRVMVVALAISVCVGLLFGMIPVWRYARPRSCAGPDLSGRRLTSGREHNRARSVLVLVQVALAMVLLVGSGLMIRSFRALRQVDPGFSGANELETMRVAIPDTQVRDREQVLRMEEAILRKLESVGSVRSVAATANLPMEVGSTNPVIAEDLHVPEGSVSPLRRFKFVSPGYVAAIGSRLIAGRDFTWMETYNKTPVAMISENMAREIWRDPRAAIGKRIRADTAGDWRQVIGVVADMRDDGIDQKAASIVYWPLLLRNFSSGETVVRNLAYIVRTPRAGSAALRKEIQQAVMSVNANLPVSDFKTLETVYERSLARTSFALALLGIASAMALVLGIVGIYGVISYAVSQRTREIGIRLALGAQFQDVTGQFLRQGLVLSGFGLICGLSAALILTRLMKSLLFEVSPADPAAYLTASAGLILAAGVASYLPARRATRVDPAEALRTE